MRGARCVAAAALALVASGAEPGRAGERAGPAFYVVLRLDGDGGVTPVLCRRVTMAAVPAVGWGAYALTPADPHGSGAVVEVSLDGTGGQRVLHDRITVEDARRGEFAPRAGERIDGRRVPIAAPAFVLRVPAVQGARLWLRMAGASAERGLDLEELAARDAGAEGVGAAVGRVVWQRAGGDPGNRLDVLIMGDGYTASEADRFAADAEATADAMFSVSPYAEYRGAVNFTALFTPSSQSGADHPPYDPTCLGTLPICCADPASRQDPRAGQFRDTAFDARFCTANIQRLLTVDDARVFAAAAAVPDWDRIVVLVNDPTYGGSGGALAVLSRDQGAVFIAQHEFGHAFTGLADEYSAPYPGYPSCSDVSGLACEPNVTDDSRRDLVKWRAWIDPSTPLPTPDTDAFPVTGLFEGARYTPEGMYRPERDCAMRSFAPFCTVCREAYVLRLYDGGWGVPSAGIDLIDPGSESPPPGEITTTAYATVTFSVRMLGPASGPPPLVAWRVGGQVVPGATAPTYTFRPRRAGTFSVEVEATDVTPLVHPGLRAPHMTSRRTWTVVVSPRQPRRRLPPG